MTPPALPISIVVEVGSTLMRLGTSADSRTSIDRLMGQDPPAEGDLLRVGLKMCQDHILKTEQWVFPSVTFRGAQDLAPTGVRIFSPWGVFLHQVATPLQLFELIVGGTRKAMQDMRRRIFLSYRRDDSVHVTGRIAERLAARYGRERVFHDVGSIPVGLDFREVISSAVGACNVLLAVIGRDWQGSGRSTNYPRRIDDPQDFVRIELECALQRKIPVVPLLVDNTSMPAADELPSSLSALAWRNGQAIRPDPDFNTDIQRLIGWIDQI